METSKIRARRDALGVSATQLAYRLGVAQSTVVRLEQSERKQTISLASLRRAAKELGCELRYEFVVSEQLGRIPAGRQRLKPAVSAQRRKSALGQALREDEMEAAGKMSGVERLKLALELSDLVVGKFRLCSTKS